MEKKVQEIGDSEYRIQNVECEDDYFIGLDIGTDSCGWAVTDMKYRLKKSNGKPLWGSYLFDEAKTAEERRGYRTARRRLARRHNRLMLLQSLFNREISKVDGTFFLRLNNSRLLAEDKDERIATKYILFGDKSYNDKDYFKQYPTIFHLRKALLVEPPRDVRLLYLACHHIIKNRGHFLFDNDFDYGGTELVSDAFHGIDAWLVDNDDEYAGSFNLNDEKLNEISNILRAKNSKSDKQKRIAERLGADKKDKYVMSVIKLISGGNSKVSDLYGVDNADDADVDLTTMDADKLASLKNEYNDACYIDNIKRIYDWSVLINILKGSDSISTARVDSYEMHRADLALLKKYVIANCPDKYKLVFRRQKGKVDNYAAYIGMDKHKSYSKSSKAAFYKFLEKEVFADGKDGFFKFIDNEIATGNMPSTNTVKCRYENGEFLPKQITSDNGVIPYQLHLKELKTILENAEKKFGFLAEKDESGLTVSQKIISLMTFRIPYYVGPIGGGKFAWAKRVDGMGGVKITPWNFESVIDKNASEDEFIARITNKCTYIPTEDVLPASSLLYSEIAFLNELNNLKINGEKDYKAIDLIYEYAHTHKKVTVGKILGVLKQNGYESSLDKNSISGIDNEIKTSLSSYIDLKKILGDKVDGERLMCEDIIKWITIMSDKNRLVKRIKEVYGDMISDAELKEIKGLNYSKWGRLSAALLSEITSDKAVGKAGEPLTVLQTMREYKINLSEALTAPRWGFAEAIERYNLSKCSNDDRPKIDSLYCSPAVKRSIRRTIAIVKEIIKIVGHKPKKIMIEMARGATEEQKNTRTKSRKQQLIELYKNCKYDVGEFIEGIESREEREFASKRLFAYYMQKGRCMYSGEKIDIADLFDKNIYDFDHIYPQSKVNDDSFDNRVLVKRYINAQKTDIYPLPKDIQVKMKPFWTELHNQKFISDKKYERLIRSTELEPQELAEFENRQLVITRQSTKEVAAILKRIFCGTEIVYSKASKTSEFKNNFEEYAQRAGCTSEFRTKLIKVRELNNLHHAKDAYINIVVGNVLNTEYGHDARVFYINKDKNEIRSDYALFIRGVKNAWEPTTHIPIVAKTFYSDNCRVVRFVNEGTGKLYDATIKTAGANDGLIPLKMNGKIADTKKYGGYDGASTAYFMLVKSIGKKNAIRLSLEAIPIWIDKLSTDNNDVLAEYLKNKCGLISPQVVISKIRINTLFTIDGSPAYIRGKTGNRIIWCNAAELYIDADSTAYLKKVISFDKKYSEAKRFKREIQVDKFDEITAEGNLKLYDLFIDKLKGKIYRGLAMSKQAGALKFCKEQFAAIPLEMQCVVLRKIMLFLNANSVHLDLSDFTDKDDKNYGKNCGINLTSKFVEKTAVRMISQSPTGQYFKITDLNNFVGQ